MPTGLTVDAWNCEIGGQEPWPDDVRLFQPYETEQILLPDNANCLAVQAFLKMCKLNYSVEYKVNAEEMSPSGKVPFIKCGACLVSELEPITNFVANKGISLTSHLEDSQKADMRAYMSLVNTVLGNAENYITWCDDETYSKVTKPRYASVHPFPLNHILTYFKRRNIIKRLSAFGWADKSLEKVYEEVERGCSALSERLEKAKFFFGDQPCEVDAALFGHTFSILTCPSLQAGVRLSEIIRSHKLIVNHCKSLMPLLDLNDDIEVPNYHKLHIKQNINELENIQCDLTDEFVYLDADSLECLGETQITQDYSCLLNEENSIYNSLFTNDSYCEESITDSSDQVMSK